MEGFSFVSFLLFFIYPAVGLHYSNLVLFSNFDQVGRFYLNIFILQVPFFFTYAYVCQFIRLFYHDILTNDEAVGYISASKCKTVAVFKNVDCLAIFLCLKISDTCKLLEC